MDTKDLEKRVNKMGGITYWKENVLIGRRCTKCGQDKEINQFTKKKDGYKAQCKECEKEKNKKYYENNADKIKENFKKYYKNNLDKIKEKNRKYYENNMDKVKEESRKHRENNKDRIKRWKENNSDRVKEYNKKWRENNSKKGKENNNDYYKAYYKNNKERYHKADKRSREKRKQNNLQEISSLLEQINPIFEQLSLPIYGYIYKFENTKTGRCYIGQTVQPLKVRYKKRGGIIKSWIKERLSKNNQKFINELIEEDIEVTEVLDIAFCQYHLDKLEVHYINKYNSFSNGYNNNVGRHKTDDGLEDFLRVLEENDLEFIDNKIIKKRSHK